MICNIHTNKDGIVMSAQPSLLYDIAKSQMLMSAVNGGHTVKNLIFWNIYETIVSTFPKWYPFVKSFCSRRQKNINVPPPKNLEIRSVITCERILQTSANKQQVSQTNHSRMDSVVHYVTTIPAIRNLICMTHHDYLPHEFDPVMIEPDLYFQLEELTHNEGQVEKIKFKLFCYEHEVQYLQAFVDRCNIDYERRMANKLGTSLYYFDMITQTKGKKSTQNQLPSTHLLYTKHRFHTTRTFDNVFFEQREHVKNHLDFFLNRRDWYEKKGIPYTLGFMFHGEPGCGKCLGIDTPVMMYDGTIKPVQDIKVGDKLMGDDSTARTVLSLARGKENMYRVVPVKGDSYVVNESHILSLIKSKRTKGEIVDINLKDYLNLSETSQKSLKGYRVPVVFPHKDVSIDAYLLGYWLGDGASTKAQITCADIDIIEHVGQILDKYDIDLLKGSDKYGWNMRSRDYKSGGDFKNNKGCNKFLTFLQESKLIGNKHIPDIYKYNSRDVQLGVLAGIIDSDGSLNANCYDLILVNEKLMDDVIYLCRSLGFSAYKTICTKTCTNGTHGPSTGTYFRTMIHGKGLDKIPVILSRKKATPRQQIKNSLVTGIKIEPIDVDEYYGFEIDGNKRFLLGDFTVTHNTSSVKAIANTAHRHIVNVQLSSIKTKEQLRHLFFNDEIHVYDGIKTERYTIPVHERLYVIEDIDAMGDAVLKREWQKPVSESKKKTLGDPWMDMMKEEEEQNEPIDLSFLLNLLDGTLEASGRILAISSNFPERIDRALIRPGRIDMIVHFKKCNRKILEEMVNNFYDKEFMDWTTESLDYKWSPAEVNQILFRNFKDPETAMYEIESLTPRDLYGFENEKTCTSYQEYDATS